MFLGHFALAMSAKKIAPKTSLGTLVLSAQFADCLWPVLLLLGFEQVRIVPGITRVTPLDFISYPISHSLLLQLGWGFLLGGTYFFWRRDLRTALVVVALLPTPCVLDYLAHRPDMPLYPGGPKVGLGMWNSLPLTVLVELGLFLIGLLVYLSATRSKGRMSYGLWSFALFLTVLYAASLLGPPPPNVRMVALSALALWLTVPWTAWADRQREQRLGQRLTMRKPFAHDR